MTPTYIKKWFTESRHFAFLDIAWTTICLWGEHSGIAHELSQWKVRQWHTHLGKSQRRWCLPCVKLLCSLNKSHTICKYNSTFFISKILVSVSLCNFKNHWGHHETFCFINYSYYLPCRSLKPLNMHLLIYYRKTPYIKTNIKLVWE